MLLQNYSSLLLQSYHLISFAVNLVTYFGACSLHLRLLCLKSVCLTFLTFLVLISFLPSWKLLDITLSVASEMVSACFNTFPRLDNANIVFSVKLTAVNLVLCVLFRCSSPSHFVTFMVPRSTEIMPKSQVWEFFRFMVKWILLLAFLFSFVYYLYRKHL